MYVSDKKNIAKEYFDHAARLKEKRDFDRKEHESILRLNLEQLKVFERRQQAAMIHEEEMTLTRMARQGEVDNRQTFLKLNPLLNVI